MFKFKWNVQKSLEYICSMKTDIEITKSIIKLLRNLQISVENILSSRQISLRADWTILTNLQTVHLEDDLQQDDRKRLRSEYSRMKSM
mmetsp:Transcript_9344/g.14124  ORF Transcript_9344/g.14124 Transcript_9344/m.14124 type:complete len:88 (+) Transcript_9344:667-930(+)